MTRIRARSDAPTRVRRVGGLAGGVGRHRRALTGLALVCAIVGLGGLISAGSASAAPTGAPTNCHIPRSVFAHLGGVDWGARSGCQPTGSAGGAALPSPAYWGSPPLTNHGGPVVSSSSTVPGELTVIPVWWLPAGTSVPSTYQSLVDRFIADAAAASGRKTNVFAALTQYKNASGVALSYKMHVGAVQTDTHSFPASGCTPDSGQIYSDGTGYSRCITNAQLLNEAASFTTAHSLPNKDLAHLYMFFLPKGVETCFGSSNASQGGTCSITSSGGFCGYHAFSAPPLVADMNYAVVDSPSGWTCSSDAGSNTGGNQSPNANIEADSEISITSHEISETITDPTGNAWYDASGNEIGDDCAYVFGDSRSFQGTSPGFYNQIINAHHYMIQSEFSNLDYKANATYSCIQNEETVTLSPKSGPAGTAITVSGGGYASAETVTVVYKTGLSSPATVTLCSTTSSNTGTYTCSGHIPGSSSAGVSGGHKITVTGATSKRTASATFTLG